MNRLFHLAGAALALAWSGSAALCGGINGWPGGLKCPDMLNNGVEYCLFAVTIGAIDAKTTAGVAAPLEHRRQSKRRILQSVVYLDSPGGNLAEAMAIGNMIRREKLSVVVEPGATCSSACVFVLAAGTSRRIDGRVGIHRPYLMMERGAAPVALDSVEREYGAILRASRAYLREMGVAERLADEMLRVAPERVRFLTRTELETYGIGEPPPGSDIEKQAVLLETLDLKSAQAWGLSRTEYMRREAIVKKSCKLDDYTAPGEPADFSAYSEVVRPDGTYEVKTRAEWLAQVTRIEEDNWSRCYKTVMRLGRAE